MFIDVHRLGLFLLLFVISASPRQDDMRNNNAYQCVAKCCGRLDDFSIEKRDKTTGALITAFDSDGIVISSGEISALAIDSNYIYAAGYDDAPGSNQWCIEKQK